MVAQTHLNVTLYVQCLSCSRTVWRLEQYDENTKWKILHSEYSHCAKEVISNVMVTFLQVISEVKRLEQVIIWALKLPYHQQMLQQTVMAAEANNMNFHQSISVLHALWWLSNAWDHISSNILWNVSDKWDLITTRNKMKDVTKIWN
jgi:hypothetical protein